jgi:hypothetical protein
MVQDTLQEEVFSHLQDIGMSISFKQRNNCGMGDMQN